MRPRVQQSLQNPALSKPVAAVLLPVYRLNLCLGFLFSLPQVLPPLLLPQLNFHHL
jgi:hypothetical protein